MGLILGIVWPTSPSWSGSGFQELVLRVSCSKLRVVIGLRFPFSIESSLQATDANFKKFLHTEDGCRLWIPWILPAVPRRRRFT